MRRSTIRAMLMDLRPVLAPRIAGMSDERQIKGYLGKQVLLL